MAQDTRYLQQRRQTWFVVVEVPPSIRAKLGRRIKRTLRTRDINLARARRWQAVADIQAQFEAARRGVQGDPQRLEALELRRLLAEETRRSDRAGDDINWGDWDNPEDLSRYEDSRTDNILRDEIAARATEIERQQGNAVAQTFFGIAVGDVTPLETYVEDWLREGGMKGSLTERTKVEHRRSVQALVGWLAKEHLGASIEVVTRRVAGRFVSEHLLPSGRHVRTISKTISTLSSYWKWLRRRGFVSDEGRNPWAEQAPSRSSGASFTSEDERDFTDAEVVRLLASPPNETLAEFMRVAALSGMRREEIGQLRVGDCAGGIFIVQRGKTAAARRRVPVHCELAALVGRRLQGKALDAFLFHELQSRNPERTDPIGKLFARYRRSLGIQEGTGRRSLVTFHSFRRWFITRAVNAGQPPHIVSLVVGHKEGRKGMTLGRYWQGAEDDALRACVEAVKLPQYPAIATADAR
jgi:integrase